MAKSNGKARKKTDRPHFSVALIPFDGRLTPARAKRWLSEEHAGFVFLLTRGMEYATEEKDREAFVWLGNGLEYMVRACSKAVQTGKSVDVVSDLGPGMGREMAQASRLLRYPTIALEAIADYFGEDMAALGQIAAMVTLRLSEAESAEAVDGKAYFAEKKAEREAEDPNNRLEKILDLKTETKKEMQAAIEHAVGGIEEAMEGALSVAMDRVAGPFEKKLKHLKYEEDKIWFESGNQDGSIEDPGKAPRGWKPATGSEALKAEHAGEGL